MNHHIQTKPVQACTLVIILLLVVACMPSPEAETQAILNSTVTIEPSATPLPSPTASPTLPPTVTPTPMPDHRVCASGCDYETIQMAIDADSTKSGDIIQVRDSTHTEAGILVDKDVIIQGQGSEQTVVQAHASAEDAEDRVFRIAPNASVAIEGMTIRHGHPGDCPKSGGGILNEGTLTLEGCVVTENIASAGGGLMNNGTLTLIDCAVSDNIADGHGGENSMGKGSGGGIKNMVGALTIINSTISGNRSAYNAGGIKVSCSGTLDMVNSTLSNNRAGKNGGGLEVRGVVTLTHTTVAHNDAQRVGGGIYLKGTSDHVRGILSFSNSVFADNTPGDCVLGDNATIGLNANNLVSDESCNPALSGDAKLGILADNGGQTQTYALLPGSPAIDAVPSGACFLDTDQRGASRPVELHSAGSPCDLGAFEAQTLEEGLATQMPSPSATNTPVPTATQLPPTESPPPQPTATPLPLASYQPLFEQARCKPALPSGYDVECGYLVVPEDRSQPDGPIIRLHVATFHSTNPEPAPDPVVHLVGGPGGSLLDAAQFYLQAGGGRILEDRDYVLFNQRGTRYAGPSLECPGQVSFGLELAEQQLPWREREAREMEFLLDCQEHLLAEGANLAAYNTVENAADVADLLRALGYDQANLYGISYGTKLALEVMRDHPQRIRSVILDSVYPLQVDINEEIASSAHRAFTTLFEGCAADPECNAKYPDLDHVFYRTVDELNANPVTVEVKGGRLDAWLDGDIFMDAVFGTLYRTDALRWLPLMITEASRGNYEPLHTPLEVMADKGGISWGMYHSMQCREETAFEDHERALEISAGLPPQVVEHYASPFAFTLCSSWQSGQAPAIEDQPVHSDIPTLVLAGQYDPVTPPSWAKQAADTLSNSFYYEFPGVGHGVMRSNDCGLEIGLQFLDDPTAEPDASCLKELSGPEFH